MSPPTNDSYATTKKFVTDLLKTKAGTTYVSNELTKKVNNPYVNDVVSSSLEDYYTKGEIDDNYVLKSDLPSDVYLIEKNYYDVNEINDFLDTIGNDLNDLTNSLYSKAEIDEKIDQIDGNLNTAISAIKPKVSIQAEENGSLINNSYQWSFGNGGSNNPHYSWPCPSSGRIICGSISSSAGNNASGQIKVAILKNAVEAGSSYIITKPSDHYSSNMTFSTPLNYRLVIVSIFEVKVLILV